MTRSFACRALLACALFAVGCTDGALGGPGNVAGTGGDTLPPPGSGGSVGSGGSAPLVDAGSGGSGAPTDANPAPSDDGGFGNWDSSAADPGTDGDGIRMLSSPYRRAPEFSRGAGVPAGKTFSMTAGASTLFPKAPAGRRVVVYVPSQYKMGTPAQVMVFQDGTDFYGFDSAIPPVLDNLIAKNSIPPLVAVFVGNGGGDSVGSERGLEYDTVSGLYAAFIDRELLPRVEMQSKTSLPNQAITFTKDPEGRGAVGGSSGGAGTFSMLWWHTDLFRRGITFSGTYVNQVPSSSPFPHGAWIYHDKDPYDATTPNGLIMEHCESATNPAKGSDNPGACDTPLTQAACTAVPGCAWNTKVNKPIRLWHESGSNDLGAGGSPSGYRNFDLANQRMAASLKARGYHFHYDHCQGAGHVDGGAWQQTFPEAMVWLWRGFKASGM